MIGVSQFSTTLLINLLIREPSARQELDIEPAAHATHTTIRCGQQRRGDH